MATSRNVFDQFDEEAESNVFDQFDETLAEEKPEGSSLLANFYGLMPETILSMGSSALAQPISGFAGIAQGAKNLISPGMPAADRVRQVQEAMTYQPRTDAARAVIEGAGVPLQKFADFADRAGDTANQPGRYISGQAANAGLDPVREDQGSPLAATLVNTGIQSAPALLLRGRSGGMAGNVNSRAGGARPGVAAGEGPAAASASAGRPSGLASVSRAPTKQQLKAAADAAYKRADESGVVVTPESFGALKSRIQAEMKREGIDATLHPDSSAALKRIADSDGSLSLQELETLRRIANDAEGSIKPADRRLAGKMVDEIDDYIDSLGEKDVVAGDATKAKALKEARNLYSRRMKAEELDKLMERAELSASNFSGSGIENAIRTEFRNLAKNERRMRRFTKEEQEAIKRVAKGGAVENALRMLGKFAPTGVVSTGLSAGAGLVAGGPVGAVALPAAGAVGRFLASRLTAQNALRANELVRRGPLPEPQLPSGLVPVIPDDIGMLGR